MRRAIGDYQRVTLGYAQCQQVTQAPVEGSSGFITRSPVLRSCSGLQTLISNGATTLKDRPLTRMTPPLVTLQLRAEQTSLARKGQATFAGAGQLASPTGAFSLSGGLERSPKAAGRGQPLRENVVGWASASELASSTLYIVLHPSCGMVANEWLGFPGGLSHLGTSRRLGSRVAEVERKSQPRKTNF